MDSAISGKQKAGLFGRALAEWEPDGGEEFCEIEVAIKGIGDWDQFAANLKLFNVHATFDENEYTTKLDFALVDTAKQTHAEDLVSCSLIYPYSSHPYYPYSNLFQPIAESLVLFLTLSSISRRYFSLLRLTRSNSKARATFTSKKSVDEYQSMRLAKKTVSAVSSTRCEPTGAIL
jgi:hypothetical protein